MSAIIPDWCFITQLLAKNWNHHYYQDQLGLINWVQEWGLKHHGHMEEIECLNML